MSENTIYCAIDAELTSIIDRLIERLLQGRGHGKPEGRSGTVTGAGVGSPRTNAAGRGCRYPATACRSRSQSALFIECTVSRNNLCTVAKSNSNHLNAQQVLEIFLLGQCGLSEGLP